MTPAAERLAGEILRRSAGHDRWMVAIAGPPGAGKSTLADALLGCLLAEPLTQAVVVPMDGFHLDNDVLEARGLLDRKGAPETFDADGLLAALQRIRTAAGPVAVPVFDRAHDLARAGARIVEPGHNIVLVEGNYLLLSTPPWCQMDTIFDMTIALQVDPAELERRLVDRWVRHGLAVERARERAAQNDLTNARLVLARSRPADTLCRT